MNDNELQFDRRCHVLYSKPCKNKFCGRSRCTILWSSGRRSGGRYSGNTRYTSRTGAPILAAKIIFTTAQAAPMTASP